MTTILPSAARRSRFLFDWNAAACLAAPEQSLNAITGQVATYSRAGIKTALDANSALRTVPYSLPAFQWSTDPVSGLSVPGVLLEDVRTDVVLWNRDLSNAAWIKTNITAVKDQTGVDGMANSASSILAGAANAVIAQAVTLASSARFQSAYVKRITGTGTVQMTTDNAATWTTVAVTSAWTRVTIPTQTLANPTVGFRLVTSGDKIAVDYVQNENGAFQSSPIATTSASVTRAADSALSFVFPALPQAMTIYVKGVNLGTAQINNGNNPYYALLGGSPNYLLLYEGATKPLAQLTVGGSSTQAIASGTNPAIGDLVEVMATLTSAGVVDYAQSLNGATGTGSTAPGAATTLPSAWASTTLSLNAADLGAGFFAYQQVRIAAGARSQAFMKVG